MKIQLEENVALPEDWQNTAIRSNTGCSATLREIPIGKSFTFEVNDSKSLKDFHNLRVAVHNLRAAKRGRRNFVVRLIESEKLEDDGESRSRKVYRIWAAPFPLEVVPKAKKAV